MLWGQCMHVVVIIIIIITVDTSRKDQVPTRYVQVKSAVSKHERQICNTFVVTL